MGMHKETFMQPERPLPNPHSRWVGEGGKGSGFSAFRGEGGKAASSFTHKREKNGS